MDGDGLVAPVTAHGGADLRSRLSPPKEITCTGLVTVVCDRGFRSIFRVLAPGRRVGPAPHRVSLCENVRGSGDGGQESWRVVKDVGGLSDTGGWQWTLCAGRTVGLGRGTV